MGIRVCIVHSGDENADLSRGAVGSTQWRRVCRSTRGGGGATDLPLLLITITALCNVVCGYVYSIQHLLYLIMINSFSLIIAPGFVWLFRRVN